MIPGLIFAGCAILIVYFMIFLTDVVKPANKWESCPVCGDLLLFMGRGNKHEWKCCVDSKCDWQEIDWDNVVTVVWEKDS